MPALLTVNLSKGVHVKLRLKGIYRHYLIKCEAGLNSEVDATIEKEHERDDARLQSKTLAVKTVWSSPQCYDFHFQHEEDT